MEMQFVVMILKVICSLTVPAWCMDTTPANIRITEDKLAAMAPIHRQLIVKYLGPWMTANPLEVTAIAMWAMLLLPLIQSGIPAWPEKPTAPPDDEKSEVPG